VFIDLRPLGKLQFRGKNGYRMKLPEFLLQDSDGEIRFNGHRIRLIDVVSRYDEGHSPEGILLDFYPTLTLPLIHRAIAFYLDNHADVRSAIDKNAAEMERLSQQPRTTPTLAELRRRLAAKHREAS
jgi:uncharacterized protein (DUF433 family)